MLLLVMTGPPQTKPQAVILYAEDEDNDVMLFRHVLENSTLPLSLQIVKDGQSAVDYLAGSGPFANRELYPFPSVVLLDLNMPLMTGFEVLGWVRNQPQFQNLPVVIYTASSHEGDMQEAQALGVDDFIIKSGDFGTIQKLLLDLQRRCESTSNIANRPAA